MKYENQENEDFIIAENEEVYISKHEELTFNLLSKNAHGTYNKTVVRKWGLETAIFLSSLIDKYKYFKIKGKLDKEGYFFNTAENIQWDTGLSKYQQTQAINQLISLRILKVKKVGMPAKLWFLPSFQIFNNLFLNFSKLVIKNLTYNNNNNKNNIKNILDKSNIYSEPNGSHKNSLIKQMELKDDLNKQKILNNKERRRLSQKDEEKIKNCSFTMKVINLWNSFAPVVPAHKSPSLIWKNIHIILNQLRKGSFFQKHSWQGANFNLFCQMNKLTFQQIKKALDRPFKKKEIINAIKLLVLYCKEGMYIEKQLYSKSLPDLFYNSKSTFVSIFVFALIKGEAKPVSETIEIECKYPKIAERLKKIDIDYDKISTVDKKQFNKIFSEIEKRLESIPKDSCEKLGLWDFIGAYYQELKRHIDLKDIVLFAFSPFSWQWKIICNSDVRPFNQIKRWLL